MNCDACGPTLTIIKTTAGHIFGGYAERSWRSPLLSGSEHHSEFVHSEKSFLFVLSSACSHAHSAGDIVCCLRGDMMDGAEVR